MTNKQQQLQQLAGTDRTNREGKKLILRTRPDTKRLSTQQATSMEERIDSEKIASH